MTILCIEISAEPGVLGLVHDNTVIVEAVLSERNQFGAALETLFQAHPAATEEIGALAVGIGPGSFTGLRVALAFAKGFALARKLPIWPLSSHQIYAANVKSHAGAIAVISHARRGHVHLSRLRGADLVSVVPRALLSEVDLTRQLSREDLLTGPAVSGLSADICAQLPCGIVKDETLLCPRVAVIAALAQSAWRDQRSPDLHALLPDYGLEFGLT